VIRLTIWLPPLVWMAVIMWFSGGDFSADNTAAVLRPVLEWLLPWASPTQIGAVHALIRKTAHVTEYGVLATLWFVALTRERRWSPRVAAWVAVAVAIGWACLDELHQSTEPSRTASVVDVGYDTAGALLASVVARTGWRRAAGVVTTVLLWTAAVGGALMLAINIGAGARSGALWVTVPVATALLVARRRRAPAGSCWSGAFRRAGVDRACREDRRRTD
jgi:VanZ family protein